MPPVTLSKSKFLHGLQCHKLLWCDFNAKDLFPPVDAATQAKFDQGHEVGELAKKLYPGGIEISKGDFDIAAILRETKAALGGRKPLYEAGFSSGGGFAIADILDPVGEDHWDIIEVKSSTDLKDVHIQDVAFQRHILTSAGLKIRRCFLVHINNQYVRKGEIDPEGIFTVVDISGDVNSLAGSIVPNMEAMRKTIALKAEPKIPIGLQCSDPYPCPLTEYCWDFLPEDSVFDLYRIHKEKAFELLKGGFKAIRRIPASFKLTDAQQIQYDVVRSGNPHIDKAGIAEFLKTLEYPVYYLDFETFSTAIPMYDLVHPYEPVPFQFSLHIHTSPKATPVHHSYLADGVTDPRPEILSRLKLLLGDTGSIVAYYATFEKNALKKSSEAYPEYAGWYQSLESRIVDLLDPFRDFAYYNPLQHGSASLKEVLPALTGKGYADLAIKDGTTASLEYCRVTFTDVAEGERAKVRRDLEEYCGLDTRGMVDIVERLRDLVG
jgi:hypothetical protein